MEVTLAESKYLIDRILPRNQISLLAAISNGGKSRFAIPTLIMFRNGLPILGLNSHPEPFCVVSRDRALEEVQNSILSMGFNLEDVPIIPAFGKHNQPRFKIMEAIHKSGAKLVFWEGLDLMVKSPNNPFEVDELLSALTAYCQSGLTIFGSVGVPKLKPGETYQNPRQLVGGSTVWERCTSSNLIIAPINARDIGDPRRLLYASLKNESSFTVAGEFGDHGILTFDGYDQRDIGAQIAKAPDGKKCGVWDEVRR